LVLHRLHRILPVVKDSKPCPSLSMLFAITAAGKILFADVSATTSPHFGNVVLGVNEMPRDYGLL